MEYDALYSFAGHQAGHLAAPRGWAQGHDGSINPIEGNYDETSSHPLDPGGKQQIT
jgi:hypothetical protein